jgi:predicted GNAT family acetyltransferase
MSSPARICHLWTSICSLKQSGIILAAAGPVIDNPAQHRFEMVVDGEIAAAYYKITDGRYIFTHTEVPFALSGQGYGSKLAQAAFEAARKAGMRVIATCPFMSRFALRHPEYAAMLDG